MSGALTSFIACDTEQAFLMTSQSRSHTKYLLPTSNILALN